MIAMELIALVIFAACIVFMWYLLQQQSKARKILIDQTRVHFEDTVALYVNVIHDKVRTLETYVDDYFHSMCSSEYPRLKQIDEALQTLTNECHEHLLHGNPEAVEQLIGFLQGRGMVVSTQVQSLTTANLHLLNEWRHKAHEYLISTVLSLKGTNTRNLEAEVQRNRDRQVTEAMLNEIIRWTFPDNRL